MSAKQLYSSLLGFLCHLGGEALGLSHAISDLGLDTLDLVLPAVLGANSLAALRILGGLALRSHVAAQLVLHCNNSSLKQ